MDISDFKDDVSFANMYTLVNCDSLIITSKKKVNLNKLTITGQNHPEFVEINSNVQFEKISLDLYKPLNIRELLSSQNILKKLWIKGNDYIELNDTIEIPISINVLTISGYNDYCSRCLTLIKEKNEYKNLKLNIGVLKNNLEFGKGLVVDSLSVVNIDSLGFHDVLSFTENFNSINCLLVESESVKTINKNKVDNVKKIQIMTDTLSGWTKFWMKLKFGKKISFVHSIFYKFNLKAMGHIR